MQNDDYGLCRRSNYIQAAMVQAAVSIQQMHGTRAAIAVLQAENLPREVIERVLAPGAPKRIAPYRSLERSVSVQLR